MATFTGTINSDNITGTTGADTMIGLKGDDTYTVNNCDDVVIEAAGEGKDKVNSSITYTLADGVEILVLGGANSIDGTGNKLDNSITGNGAANRLTTGDGLDTIIGGSGNDTIMAGGFLTAADKIDGGTGTDMLVLDGDYAAQLVMSATTVIGVERIKLIDGNDYNLKLDNATNSAALTIDGSRLTAGNTLAVDGSAETTSALTAIGGADNDTLTGGAGADTLTGGAGADQLNGGAGSNDTASYAGSSAGVTIDLGNAGAQVSGGDGNGDTLTGIEHLIGSSSGDKLTGTAANNSLAGGDGNDTLTAGDGKDTVRGGAGNDALVMAGFLTAADTVDGGDGFDTLSLNGNYAAGLSFGANVTGIEEIDLATGNSYKLTLSTTTNVGGLTVDGSALGVGNNLILGASAETDSALTALGGAGNDSIAAGGANDTLDGGSGNDTLAGGAGDDLFEVGGNLTALDRTDGGAGLDTLSFDGATTAVFGAATAINIETFQFAAGSSYNLKLNAATNATAMTIDGSALGGLDSLTVDGSLETTGKFTFIGGAGTETFTGGGGADTFIGSAGADSMTGGNGIDTVTYAAAAAITVDLETGTYAGGAAGDKLSGIETIIGSENDDTISGDKTANTILAGDGDDTVGGGSAGNDTILGEDGDDAFTMGAALTAADKLDGGDGFDKLELNGNSYALGLVFSATTAVNIEQIDVVAGNDYNLTLSDAISAGDLKVDGSGLGAGDTLRVIGTADKSNLSLIGGAANDTLSGGSGSDTLVGGGGGDSLSGGAGTNWFEGGAGKDTITGGAGVDTIDYSASTAVTIDLGAVGGVQVSGGDANGDKVSAVENVLGSGSADKITGSTAANLLQGGGADDTLNGGLGNDTLEGGAGADQIVGGSGIDMASYAGSGAVSVDLTTPGTKQASGGDASNDVLTEIEGVIGSGNNDTLTSGNAGNILNGEDGSDVLIANAGNDTLNGGSGNDTLDFTDKVTFAALLNSLDKIDGGDGYDTVLVQGNYPAGISLNATNFVNVEEIDLAAGNNYSLTIATGTLGASVFIDGSALAGNTLKVSASGSVGITVQGGGLADTVTGTTGGDYLFGSAGADSMSGNTGVDTVDYSGSGAGVTVNLNVATAQVSGGDASGDRLSGIENAIGSGAGDMLLGTTAVNNLDGSGGNDVLRGGAGADTLVGGLGKDTADYSTSTAGVRIDLADSKNNAGGDAAGDRLVTIENVTGSNLNDTLSGDDKDNNLDGGNGNDSLIGGIGADTLTGGAGVDIVSYAASKDLDTDGKGVSVDLAAETGKLEDAEGDSLKGIESVIGSDFNDTLVGSTANNALTGGVGADEITAGNGGNDTLSGGVDADTFFLGGKLTALDRIDGGTGFTLKDGKDYDIVVLDGDYSLGLTFAAATMVNVEELRLLGGNDYVLNLASVANPKGLTIEAGDLGVGDFLKLTGTAGVDTLSFVTAAGGVTADISSANLVAIENLTGSKLDDTLTGNKNNNLIVGGAGGDTIDGGLGIDTVSYIDSNDAVTVNLADASKNAGGDAAGDKITGIEIVIGSLKDDDVTGIDGVNLKLDGRDGADTLTGANGNDTLLGGVDDDNLSDGAGNDSVVGDSGGDVFVAGGGNDTLSGGDDADIFKMGANLGKLDRIDGGTSFVAMSDPPDPHKDKLVLDGDYSTLLTFAPTTVVNVEIIELADKNSYNLKLDNATNTAGLEVDGSSLGAAFHLYLDGSTETSSALTASGGAGDDSLVGGGGADVLTGGAGADTLVGGGGSDTASYKGSAAAVAIDLGTNVSTGGDANGDNLTTIENLIGSGNDDTLTGNAGNNTLEGGGGGDKISGGDGIDVASYEGSSKAVTVDLSTNTHSGGDAAGDSLTDIEGVIGSDHDDDITGTGSANILKGGKGDDTIDADCGNDTVDGGKGDDEISLGHDFTALDRIDGGDGNDKLFLDGNYAAGVVFSATTVVNVEQIILAAGNSYKLTLNDAANKDALTIDGSALDVDETLYVNGVSELSDELALKGGGANDTLIGGAVADGLTGGAGDDSLTGNAGGDALDGGAGNDNMVGGSGNDSFVAGDGTDTMNGGADSDTFKVGAFLGSSDRIDGGTGTDELVLDGDYSGGVVFNAATMINVERITVTDGFSYRLILDQATNTSTLTVDGSGLTGGNSLYLDGSKETLSPLTATGGTGDDTIIGGGGSDSIVGGAGADSLRGGAGIDTLSYSGSAAGVDVDLGGSGANSGGDAAGDITNGFENLIGSALDDTLTGNSSDNLLIGGQGADALSGGLGIDTVSYADSKDGVWVDLSAGAGFAGDAFGDTYTGIENIIGTDDFDWLIGNGSANKIEGGGEDDLLVGNAGNDTLLGGSGDDLLEGGAGADYLDGGAGAEDTASYRNSNAAVSIDLNLATAQGGGGDGTGDILLNIANLIGSKNNDRLIGDTQDNHLNGLAGADTLTGGGGFDYVDYDESDAAVFINFNAGVQSGGHAQGDVITESEGVTGSGFNDRIIGDEHANGLYGNGGADTLTGGALNDIFGFNTIGDGVDVVTDFQVGAGGDVLHIGNILIGYDSGDDINDFMRIVSSGGQTVMQIDQDGAAGGQNFVDCAVLQGVSAGISVDALFDNGQINPFPGTI